VVVVMMMVMMMISEYCAVIREQVYNALVSRANRAVSEK
jgi:hypothetical protein